jgi:mannose/fructose/N-acetylgalactosamine-specific phosphotransferase system component IIB
VGAAARGVVVIVLSRIDNRLIHGQVIEAWVPHLRVRRLVVADDVTANDAMAQAAMGLAVPESVEVLHTTVDSLDARALSADAVPTLILFRDVEGAVRARAHGLPDGRLTVGNVHAGPGRAPVSRSVFLTVDEAAKLDALGTSGMDVVIQAVPSETPVRVSRAA